MREAEKIEDADPMRMGEHELRGQVLSMQQQVLCVRELLATVVAARGGTVVLPAASAKAVPGSLRVRSTPEGALVLKADVEAA